MRQNQGFTTIVIISIILAIIIAIGLLIGGYILYQSTQKTNENVFTNTNSTTNRINSQAKGTNLITDNTTAHIDNTNTSLQAPGINASINGDNVSLNTTTSQGEEREVNNTNTIQAKINSVLIFDASGSMGAKSNNTTRMTIAKDAMKSYVQGLNKNVNLSVIAYGHKGDNTQSGKDISCKGIEEIYYMGPVNTTLISSKISNLKPNGWTPLAKSLEKAGEILNKNATPNTKMHITLLSDGKETCGGDPIAIARKLKAMGIIIDVIGLEVDNATAKQLNSISLNGGGVYMSVGDSSELGTAINNIETRINTGGTSLNIGSSNNNDNVELKTDDVNMKINDDAVEMNIDVQGNLPF